MHVLEKIKKRKKLSKQEERMFYALHKIYLEISNLDFESEYFKKIVQDIDFNKVKFFEKNIRDSFDQDRDSYKEADSWNNIRAGVYIQDIDCSNYTIFKEKI